MKPEQQRKILDLFDKCKRERMEIGWIIEEPWQPRYQGKEVEFQVEPVMDDCRFSIVD